MREAHHYVASEWRKLRVEGKIQCWSLLGKGKVVVVVSFKNSRHMSIFYRLNDKNQREGGD